MKTSYRITLNMEYCRSADMGFAAGVGLAAKLGYKWVEPMVHTGWELLSEAGYFHSTSLEEDPLLIKEICDKHGIRISSLSAHAPLMKPEASVTRLIKSVVAARAAGCGFINTDAGLKPDWMDDEWAHHVMRYTLTKAEEAARRHKVHICLEPHDVFTRTSPGLLRIFNLVPSPWIAVNWDTGNSYIAGVEDPYDGLGEVKQHVRHVHAKDISMKHSEAERGKVTGTPVGCACGEGVVDWDRVFSILDDLGREIFLSVECGRIDEAERSLTFLRKALGDRLIDD